MSSSDWVTVIVAVAGIIGTLGSGPITQRIAGKSEERRLMNAEGRAAVAAFLAGLTQFHAKARAVEGPADILADLELTVARVQITCSTKVAELASEIHADATVIRVVMITEHHRAFDQLLALQRKEEELVNEVRRILKLGDLTLPGGPPASSLPSLGRRGAQG